MKFFTTEQIGPKRSKTPEGYLVVEGVPIARIGEHMYIKGETPVAIGLDGIAHVARDEDALFNPSTIASFNGKPVVDNEDMHTPFVSPQTWDQLTCGIMMNVRRGTGMDSDKLLADLMITRPRTIRKIEAGNPEVSAGYDCGYIQFSPGRGKQVNILGNHLALVKHGRCGSGCSIGDQASVLTGDTAMAKKWWERALEAITGNDPDAARAAVEEGRDAIPEGVVLNVHTADGRGQPGAALHEVPSDEFEGRIAALEESIAGISGQMSQLLEAHTAVRQTADAAAQAVTAQEQARTAQIQQIAAELPEALRVTAAQTTDSAMLVESFQEVVAGAEVLAPGIRIPTFDKAATPGATVTAMCSLRRRALDIAFNTQADVRSHIDEVLAGKTFDIDTMPCDEERKLFQSAVAAKKASNNKQATTDAARVRQQEERRTTGAVGAIRTPAEFNKRMTKHYGTGPSATQ